MPRRAARGFTLIEMMVTLAIALILAALTYAAFGRTKPRAGLNGFTLEVRALLHGARQTALATGKPVTVMIFPTTVTGGGTGRLIVYQDGNGDFFSSTATVNFSGYSPSSSAAGTLSEVLDVVDFPAHVVLGPVDGQGSSAVMPAPFTGIAINGACAFCLGANNRGAITFDPSGAVTFQAANGPPLAFPSGASISLRADSPDLPVTAATGAEVRTLAISAATGALRTLNWKP